MKKDELIKFLQEQFQQVRQEQADLALLVHKLFKRILVAEIMIAKTKGFTKKRLETAQKNAEKVMGIIAVGVKQKIKDKDIPQYKKYLPKLH